MGTQGLIAVQARIAAACRRVDRDPAEVTLVAVSKAASDEAVLEAYATGHRDFGENRAESLSERSVRLPGDIRWHFIGRLQGNKVRRARPVTHLLHALDRSDLIRYWVKGPGRPPNALVQVNVTGEGSKAGVEPDGAGPLIAGARSAGIEVVGLMTMAPIVAEPELARPAFRALADLRRSLATEFEGLDELSMGMTDDFEVAVEEGATILRVGRAIFGPLPEG